MFKAKNILVPVDFSPESALAVDWAILLAKSEPGVSVHLCHVSPHILVPVGPEAIGVDYARLESEEKKAAKRKLEDLKRRIPKKITSTVSVTTGQIAQEIEQLCHRKAIDLVVMTTHGRTGLGRFLHGSTTEETARVAPCPVLVLHLNRVTRAAVREVSRM